MLRSSDREPKRRNRSKIAVRANAGAKTILGSLLVIAGLMLLPVITWQRHGVKVTWVGAYDLSTQGSAWRATLG